MKVSLRIALSLLVCVASILLVAGSGSYVSGLLSEQVDELSEHLGSSLERLLELRASLVALKLQSSELGNSREAERARERALTQVREKLEHVVQSHSVAVSHTERSRLLSDVTELISQFEIFQIQISHTKNTEGLLQQNRELLNRSDIVLGVVDKEIQAELRGVKNLVAENSGTVTTLRRVYYFIILLSLCIVYFVGQDLVRTIRSGVDDIRASIDAVDTLKSSTRVMNRRDDEFGELVKRINALSKTLERSTLNRGFLNRLLHSMPNAIFVLDTMGKIEAVNQATLDMLGFGNEAELVGTSFVSLTASKEYTWQDSSNSRPGGDRQTEVEVQLRSRSGDPVAVQLSTGEIIGDENESLGQVCVAKDARVLRQVEAERDRYRIELAKSEQLASLGTIVAIIAHKINQPLTVIKLYLQRSIRENDKNIHSELIEDCLHECLSEVDRVAAAIKEVLGMSRSGNLADVSWQRLDDVYRKVVDALRDQLEASGLRVSRKGEWRGVGIEARAGELDTIFFFITQNAIQAAEGRRDAKLEITCNSDGESVTLEFVDSCGGIEKENFERIFETFFTTKAPGEGTGLGLPIVKQIVHRMEGEITAHTTEGIGTSFVMRLPIENKHVANEIGGRCRE